MSGLMSGEPMGERDPTLDIGLVIFILMPAVMPDIPIDIPVLLDTLLSRESATKDYKFTLKRLQIYPQYSRRIQQTFSVSNTADSFTKAVLTRS